jgi:monoamine oxidase
MSTVVIGAGLAGLAAARRLQSQGDEVVVVEARDCIGGRTRTLRDRLAHGQPADLGASLIDIGQDMILQVCDEFGLDLTPRFSLFPVNADGSVTAASHVRNPLVLDGQRVDAGRAAEIADEIDAALVAIPPSATEMLPAWAARSGLSPQARTAICLQAGANPVDVPWRVQMSHISPPETGKLVWMLADGTDSVAHAIADGLDIRCNQPARLVARAGSQTVVETDSDNFRCDEVVVAIPVTPSLRLAFDPVLPPWKVDILLSTPMSQGGKIVGQYTHGAHITEAIPRGALSDGPVASVWCRPLGPEDTVVLLGLMPDRADGFLRDEERALTALDDLIRAVVGDGPQRIAGVLRDWTSEEFTGGVVSSAAADLPRHTALLAEQVGRVHFAGEHTADLWTTSMDGALRSGLRAADEILGRRGARAFAAGSLT